jgi:hypothetical protein
VTRGVRWRCLKARKPHYHLNYIARTRHRNVSHVVQFMDARRTLLIHHEVDCRTTLLSAVHWHQEWVVCGLSCGCTAGYKCDGGRVAESSAARCRGRAFQHFSISACHLEEGPCPLAEYRVSSLEATRKSTKFVIAVVCGTHSRPRMDTRGNATKGPIREQEDRLNSGCQCSFVKSLCLRYLSWLLEDAQSIESYASKNQ